jgi:hypothetical protein
LVIGKIYTRLDAYNHYSTYAVHCPHRYFTHNSATKFTIEIDDLQPKNKFLNIRSISSLIPNATKFTLECKATALLDDKKKLQKINATGKCRTSRNELRND